MAEDTVATDTDSSDAPPPSMKVDLAYALVTLGTSTIWTVMSSWLLYFYIPPEGNPLVPPALYGTVLLLVKPINALATIPTGYLSDHTRSRWGRRLPWMFVTGLPLLAFFVLLWTPPLSGESIWNLVYLASILVLYNIAYTSNQVPYMALLPELARTDKHRVRVSGWTSAFLLVGMILGGLAGPAIGALGYADTALIYGAAMLPCLYLPFIVLRESKPVAKERLNIRQALSSMLKNRPFIVMTLTGFCYWGIAKLVQATVPYVVTEVCLLSESDTWYFYLAGVVTALLCYPLVTWAAGRWGKRRVFAASLLAAALSVPSLLLVGDWLPVPLAVQGVVWIVLQAFAVSGVVMLPPAFGAEIVDHDETLTGRRREGVYYAVWGVLDQVVGGLVSALLPVLLLLGRSHTDPRGPLGVKAIAALGGVLLLVGFFVFLNYPKDVPTKGVAQ